MGLQYALIVAVSSLLNYSNNAIIQFFLPVFTERALERGISEFQIGLILSVYAFSIVLQSFLVEGLRQCIGSKRTYMLGVTLGALVSALSIALNYAPRTIFVALAFLLKFCDGIREPQFEVVAFVYFAEGVLPHTTKAMQGRAISIYKTFGSLGYLLGSFQAPLLLEYLGYSGGFAAFLMFYSVCWVISSGLLPQIDSLKVKASEKASSSGDQSIKISMLRVLLRKDLQPCFIAIFMSMFA